MPLRGARDGMKKGGILAALWVSVFYASCLVLLVGKGPKKLLRSFEISGVSFFFGIEYTKVHNFSLVGDLSAPPAILPFCYALHAGGVASCRSSIGAILGLSSKPQIDQPIV